MTQKVVLDLGSACNALCLNRDSTLLAAAGRKGNGILRCNIKVHENLGKITRNAGSGLFFVVNVDMGHH